MPDDTGRDMGRIAGRVACRYEFDQIEGDKSRPAGGTGDQFDDLPVGQTARSRRHDGGHGGAIDRVAIETDHAVHVLGYEVERLFDSGGVYQSRGDDVRSPEARIVELLFPGAAEAANSRLDDALDMGHFGSPPHGA